MFQKRILSKPKWEAQDFVMAGGGRDTLASRSDGTAYKHTAKQHLVNFQFILLSLPIAGHLILLRVICKLIINH